MKKIFIILFIFAFSMMLINANESIRISQIDTSSLLFNQDVKIYVSVTDKNGVPVQNISRDEVAIYESVDEKNFKKINDIKSFVPKGNYDEGINFLLMIDNSGSMYFDMKGNPVKDENATRISAAKNAVKTFVKSMKNPKDKIGLVTYNSYYSLSMKPTEDKSRIYDYLDKIKKPTGDEAWTEIYSSLFLAIDEFRELKGRKVIIILSDGENMPYYKYTGKEHKAFGKKIFTYNEPVIKSNKEGISIFSINFGSRKEKKDENLSKISRETGGTIFDAYNENELNNVYSVINTQILNEYVITYKATMDPADKKYIRVSIKKNEATRYYFSSSIFGLPLKNLSPFIILAFLLAILGLWLLSLIKFKNKRLGANLEVITTQVGHPMTRVLTINKGKTVIGGSQNADMTIVGATSIKDEHASIEYDNITKSYTIVANGDLTVNNKPVRKKRLESGDVVSFEGTTIVFDEGMSKKKNDK